jgi:diguanylate cyclase
MLIALITALLGLPTGFVVGWLTCQLLRGPQVVVEQRAAEGEGSLLSQIAHRAHSLTRQVRSDVGRHHASLLVAHAELQAGDASVVDRIVSANEGLLEQLADAEEQFVSQEFAIQQHMREARQDSLTSLENRRAFDKELAERFDRWQSHDTEFCLALIDVDHFKRINDEYGHPIGDSVLKSIAATFSACARPDDAVFRLGGEEFGILLADCSVDQGWQIVDRLRHAIADHPIPAGSAMLRLTVSLGLASVRSVKSTDDLVTQADRALYSAKEAGRNRAYYFSGAGYDPVNSCIAREIA